MSTVLLVGGTGTIGQHTATLLVSQGVDVRVGSRTPATAKVPEGARAVQLDIFAPATFGPALEGVDAVFVLSPPGLADQFAALRPFVDAVIASTTKKIVLMTAEGVQYADGAPLRRLEQHIEGSGKTFAILRPGWFMQNFQTYWYPTIMGDGMIAVPAGEGRSAFIDARDIAGVAALALTSSRIDGQAVTLTGPESLTYGEAAAVLSAAAGRPIGYVDQDEQTFKGGLVAAGLPEDYAGFMVMLFSTVRAGHAAAVSDQVQSLLGRARTLKDYATDHAAIWRR